MLRNFYLLCAFAWTSLAAVSQTDMTSWIVNPSFEQDVTGWEVDGMSRQGNDVFKKKDGAHYMEKWTGRGGTVGNASLKQTVKGLPAGLYTVTCAAQNIQEDTPTKVQKGVKLFAGTNKTDVNVLGDYKASAVVVDGNLEMGFVLSGATGNYVCVDDFRLTKEENTAETYAAVHSFMQGVLDEAAAVDKHLDIKEQKALDEAVAAVKALMAQDVTEGVAEAVVRLKEATYDYRLVIASDEATIDMTSLIVNPSFEVKGTEGWKNVGMATQGNSVFNVKAGNIYAEKWTGRGGQVGDASISQLVTLPNGRYIMTAAAQNIQEDTPKKELGGAWIFADENKTPVTVRKKDYALEFVVIEGQATIGFMASGAEGNWIAVDNFHLTYTGRSEATLLEALALRSIAAKALLELRMNGGVKNNLEAAIAAADALKESEGMEPVAIALRENMEKAESSIAAYAALARAIAGANVLYGAGEGNEAAQFMASIDEAQAVYDNDDKVEAELAAAVKALEAAQLLYNLDNATGPVPEVTTHDFVARGATGALGRSTVKGADIIEKGFCWATHPNPTIFDDHSTFYYDINGPMYLMQPLKPATVYYVRAYAMTSGYAVGYGEVRKVITVPMGTCGWWYNNGGSAEENDRINFALAECIYYYNNWSGIQGFNISCSYGSGTPTADCGYGGGMRVGPNASYQRTGTILHESNHGVGVGTQGRWWDTNLHDGVWKGRRANQVLRFVENNPTATMAGDGMHMWPYGINGAHEDSGWPMLYIANVMITYAMHEDGLIPPGHGGNTPAYAFDCEDNVKYYIVSELNAGAYLYDAGNALKWSSTDAEAVKADDAYAWYVDFTPSRLYYRLRNAKTGKYISYAGGTIKPSAKANPTDSEYFQLMASRNDISYETSSGNFTTCGYWVMAGQDQAEPNVMTCGSKNAVTTTQFNISDAAANQRWLFLTADEIDKMDEAAVELSKDNLRKLVAGAKGMLDVPHVDVASAATDNMTALVAEAEDIIANSLDAREIDAASTEMWNCIGAFITGTAVSEDSQLYNVTFMMDNAAFDGIDGWTCSPNPTQREGISEYYQTTYEVTQSIADMPAGRYEFHVQGFERPGSYGDAYSDWSRGNNKVKAYIYYKNSSNKQLLNHIMADAQARKIGSGIEQQQGGKYIPDDMLAASKYFARGLYDNVLVFEHASSGKMLLGLRNTQNVGGDWTAFDNFRLFSHGNPLAIGVDAAGAAIEGPAAVYDLTGRRLGKVLRRGIYITGGKKVLF